MQGMPGNFAECRECRKCREERGCPLERQSPPHGVKEGKELISVPAIVRAAMLRAAIDVDAAFTGDAGETGPRTQEGCAVTHVFDSPTVRQIRVIRHFRNAPAFYGNLKPPDAASVRIGP